MGGCIAYSLDEVVFLPVTDPGVLLWTAVHCQQPHNVPGQTRGPWSHHQQLESDHGKGEEVKGTASNKWEEVIQKGNNI